MSAYKNIYQDSVSTVIGGIVLSFIFFLFSDFFYTPPNISGQWYFVNETKDTTYTKFKNLKVYYNVMLIQQGSIISGQGEKIQDELNGKLTEYSGKGKIQIRITGHLKQNFITKDKLSLYYTEEGEKRGSSTFHNLVRFSDERMEGGFSSTIANSTGKTLYSRTLERLSNPD